MAIFSRVNVPELIFIVVLATGILNFFGLVSDSHFKRLPVDSIPEFHSSKSIVAKKDIALLWIALVVSYHLGRISS